MELRIKRGAETTKSTTGEFFIDGTHFCYTIERPGQNVSGAQAPFRIKAGIYKAVRRYSAHNKKDVIGLLDVPGRTDIEIHSANWAFQLLGCIAVGEDLGHDYIGESDIAFNQLMEKINGQDLTVVVEDPEVI